MQRAPASRWRALLVALTAAAGAFVVTPAARAGGGVDDALAQRIKERLAPLFNRAIDTDNVQAVEEKLLDVEKVLARDRKDQALKSPSFWAEAIQECRFSGPGCKRRMGPTGLGAGDFELSLSDGKSLRSPWVYHAGRSLVASKPAPVVVAVLEKGMDPKKYIEDVWLSQPEVLEDWVVVAVVESDAFPVTQDPFVAVWPFCRIRDVYNVDAQRFYLEGVGAAGDGVQVAAAEHLASRLAGLILRGPKSVRPNENAGMFPTLIVEPGADVTAWIAQHPERRLPSRSTFVTTITDVGGEQWTGSLWIQSPVRRGTPTRVTVTYVRGAAGGTIDIRSENLAEFFVFMNDDLVDLDRPVAVLANSNRLTEKIFERQFRVLFDQAMSNGEYGRVFMARYRGVVPNATSSYSPRPEPEEAPPPVVAPPPSQSQGPDPVAIVMVVAGAVAAALIAVLLVARRLRSRDQAP